MGSTKAWLLASMLVASAAHAQPNGPDAPNGVAEQSEDAAEPAPAEPAPAEPAPAEPAPEPAEQVEPRTEDQSVPAADSHAAHASHHDDIPAEPDPLTGGGENLYPEEVSEDPEMEERVRYFLEAIEVRGPDRRTRSRVIRSYIPLEAGDVVNPEDPMMEAIEWRLRGTGWFSQVRVHLERGQRRGWVVLVVDVVERNTIVVEQLTFGISEGLNGSLDLDVDRHFYVGATIAETNLLGTGARLALSGLGSQRARGLLLEYEDPRLFPGRTALRASFFYNNAREYFGNAPLVDITCPEDVPECEPNNAVVFYKRGGLSIGTGRDLGSSTRLTLDWRGELIDVGSLPDAASENRGGIVQPIDFAIKPGSSFVSTLRMGLNYDHRDDPAMTTRGTHFRLNADLGTGAIGSDYDFLRLQASFRQWVPLGQGHSLRFGAVVGAIFGEAPFFYKFHVSDFSDFIPGRYLEMQLDRRPSVDVFNTSIAVMRQQQLAARIDVQYEAPLYARGQGVLRTLRAYLNVGLFALGDRRDLRTGLPGYQGFSRFPVDLTLDLGLRFDLSFGVFQIGFSNILGFINL
ncbi:MAG: outer membrane protein insertion porin family [Polyangiales bacterium]|jgi:outer membrane protein insertion porin family